MKPVSSYNSGHNSAIAYVVWTSRCVKIMNYYRLEDDIERQDRWFLDTVIPGSNDEWAFWSLVDASGVPVEERWKVRISHPGAPLDFTFSGFGVPIANQRTKEIFERICSRDFEALPVEIKGIKEEHYIIRVHEELECVDEGSSIFDKWTEKDGRPEKIGEFRTVTHLKIDRTKVASGKHIFRIKRWGVVIVVSETLARALRQTTGIKFENIT